LAIITFDLSALINEMADRSAKTYCPVCERPIKTNARGLLHRHNAGTDRHTEAEFCPGSGQPPVDEATIIEAGNAENAAAAMAAITEAVAAGELSLGEAETASALVERFTRALEAGEFEKRLRALQAAREKPNP
jgi:hypothetical protein